MKITRIISMFLAVLFMISMCAVTVGATDTTTGTTESTGSGQVAEKVTYTYYTASGVPRTQYFKDKELLDIEGEQGWDEPMIFDTPQEKLAQMDLRLQKDGYQIYIDEYSGEVACRNLTTEEVLFTNPYTVGNSVAKGDYLYELMSQILVEYTDKSTGITKTFTSFEEASTRGQIKVKNIKNGLRVEYTIGREEAKMLVPRLIEKSRFETKIQAPLEEALSSDGEVGRLKIEKVTKYYVLYELTEDMSDSAYDSTVAQLPITKKMAVYSIDGKVTSAQLAMVELLIKTYVPSYTYEDLDYDHELTEYEGEEENPPLFKMALEYTLGKDGLSVTLPANGIRFDESRYTLENITVLPYMGAGMTPNEGYTFFPDGSGALFDFEELAEMTETKVSGKVYGVDYAYQTITATHQETIRYPVFGVVETQKLTELAPDNSVREYEQDRGYVAIITEGDSMAEITSYHGGKTTHEYHAIRMTYYPRPKDSYNIKDAISSTSNGSAAMWEVVSSRKYTGNYTIRYSMLTDDEIAAQVQHDMGEGEVFEYYECSYMGMAEAYRDYLVGNGTLTPLTSEDVTEDIPLYINTFGAIETTEKIMSIPVDVTVPLTSFSDVMTMYSELSAQGITNLNFKLTGYANGGMYATVPYYLDWEKAVGGDDDFELLLKDATEKGYKVFPDFDFVYVSETGLVDGLSLRKHVVKSIDNRYTSRREYSATKQAFVSYFEMCLSPAYFEHFYTKLTSNYLEYFTEDQKTSISIGTLGSELNSDFDEDEPYNREDAKDYTIQAFKYFDENYDYVMTSGGNAYSWQYVDYILDVPLDSSRFIRASASVPFMGLVLHGYIQFAGTPINMEGNLDYAFLKAIENGASINFILSYQNTTTLKEDVRLSKYYSIRYDIWFDDVVSIYNELNSLLSDVQLEVIVGHEFIDALRVADIDEAQRDLDNAILESIEAEREALDKQELDKIQAILNARQLIRINSEALKAEITKLESYKAALIAKLGYTVDANGNVSYTSGELQLAIKEFNTAVQGLIREYNGGQCTGNSLSSATAPLNSAAAKLSDIYNQTKNGSVNYIANQVYESELAARKAYENAVDAYELLCANEPEDSDYFDYIKELAWSLIEDTAASLATVGTIAPSVYEIAQDAYDYAISGKVMLTDANGNELCEVNAYQVFLYAAAGYISVKPNTAIETKNALQRYEIGLSKSDLTATSALEQIRNLLGVESSAETPDYATIFSGYLNMQGQVGFETRYQNFVTSWENYKVVYEKYKNKQATSDELKAARTPVVNYADQLNKEFGYFLQVFSLSNSKATVSGIYSDATKATLLEQLNTFSAAYASCVSATTAPTNAQIKALNDAAAALGKTFTEVGNLYAVIPAGSAFGINAYAQNAAKHETALREAMETAASVLKTLEGKTIAEGDEGYAEHLVALEAAREYAQYTADAYNAIAADAAEVIRLANEAYTVASALEENQKYLKLIDEIMIFAEEDAELKYVIDKFTNILHPYDYVAVEPEDELLEDEEEVYNKYDADDNSVVLVTYENGTRFLLNYCNYTVVVEIDGISYRVESQSYQKIPKQAESEVEDSDQ